MLLGVLDQYCFRCHSSVLYSVFDKQGVIDRKDDIAEYVQLPSSDIDHMRQGRKLDGKTIEDIVNYVQALK